jgi:hypothetical protein
MIASAASSAAAGGVGGAVGSTATATVAGSCGVERLVPHELAQRSEERLRAADGRVRGACAEAGGAPDEREQDEVEDRLRTQRERERGEHKRERESLLLFTDIPTKPHRV